MPIQKATFAAGCFWGVELAFRKVTGVISAQVGYIGGKTENPTYQEVCTNETGHAEAVELEYDPAKVSYDELLKVFFDLHDPTTLNRQGPDIGSQYRSAIFYHSEAQRNAAEAFIDHLDQSGRFKKQIVTEITSAPRFYPAEDFHQRYLEKRGIDT
jgi:peptide-methionine (S)-S-oxide reductase